MPENCPKCGYSSTRYSCHIGSCRLGYPENGRRCVGSQVQHLCVEQVQVPLQFPARQSVQVTDEVSVDVIGVIFVLDERPIDEDLGHSDLPKLLDHHAEVLHQLKAPSCIPSWRDRPRRNDEHRVRELVERQKVIAWRQQSFGCERGRKRPPRRSRRRAHEEIVAMLDISVKPNARFRPRFARIASHVENAAYAIASSLARSLLAVQSGPEMDDVLVIGGRSLRAALQRHSIGFSFRAMPSARQGWPFAPVDRVLRALAGSGRVLHHAAELVPIRVKNQRPYPVHRLPPAPAPGELAAPLA